MAGLAAVVGVDLALARVTGGPCPPSLVAAAVVEVALVGLLVGAADRAGPVAAATALVLPPVVHGAWACAQNLEGRAAWEPMVALTAVLVWVRATRAARAGGGSTWGPRQAVGVYALYLALGWLVMAAGGNLPSARRLGALGGTLAAGIALGPAAPLLGLAALVPDPPSAPPPPRPVATGKPDLVLLTVDALRFDAARNLRTYRRLASEGHAWQAQAPAPWTLPSLASILTGTEPWTHGAGRVGDGYGGLSADVPTLAERLRDAGYDTVATVHSPFSAAGFGLRRGFDRFDAEGVDDHVVPGIPYGNRARPLSALTLVPFGADARVAEVQALRRGDRPLFLWVHLFDAHIPYRHASGVEASFLDRRLLATANYDLLAPLPEPRVLDLLRRGYDHELEVVDDALERILDALPPAPNGRVVVLTADHGEAFGEHGGWEHGHSVYQELLAVPLVITGIEGLRSPHAGLIDIAPTLLAAAGLDASGTDGRDLRRDGVVAYRSGNPMYGDPATRAVQLGPRKLIRSDADHAYALDTDPGELSPLAGDPELAGLLPPPTLAGDGLELTDDVRAGLEALGYLSP